MWTPGSIRRTCLLAEILDFIWPRRCEVCGRPADRPGRHVCSECVNRLPFAPTQGCCRQCGRAAEKLDGEYLCTDCKATKPSYDRAASALQFDGDAREAVNAFKFRSHLWLRDDLTDWLEAVVRARFNVGEIELLLPMPSTLRHRVDRGYNQCAYLAKALAKRLEKPYGSLVLWRKGHPQRQGGLDEEARRENVLGTFVVRKPSAVVGKTVLVVDDIMTTGSTLSECAAELKRAGAARVWCATVARSLRT